MAGFSYTDEDFLARFPQRDSTIERRVFVRGCPPEITAELLSRGYEPVELFTIARDGDEKTDTEYLFAKAQAIEERTIDTTAEERKALELELRARGHLNNSTRTNYNVRVDGADALSLLNWDTTRHTLSDNSTVQSAHRKKLGDN